MSQEDFAKIDWEWISSIPNCLHNKRKGIPNNFACKVTIVVSDDTDDSSERLGTFIQDVQAKLLQGT